MAKKDIVVQANALIACDRNEWTLQEHKIFLYLVSRIDSIKDNDFRMITFRVSDFADIVGVKGKGFYGDLERITKSMLGRVFSAKTERGIKYFQALSRAEYIKGSGIIELTIHPDMKPFLLEISKNFTAYELNHISKMSSLYALRIYELTKMFEGIGNVTYSIKDLRNKLGIKEGELINFAHFNDKALKIAQREINGKTDMRLSYEPMKEGRKVTQVRFKVKFLKRKLGKQERVIGLLPGKQLQPLGETSANIINNLRPTSSVKRMSATSKTKRATSKNAPTIISQSTSIATAAIETVSTDVLLLKASIFQRARYYLRSLFSK